jgi:hypothetical protein
MAVTLLRSGERRRPADRAQVHAGQPPAVGPPDGDVGGPEAAVCRVALEGGVLGVPADRDRGLAVVAHGDLVPGQVGRGQLAGAVALQPLAPVQHEAERPDQGEVLGAELGQRVDVGVHLGPDPAVAELPDLLAGGRRAHGLAPLIGWMR